MDELFTELLLLVELLLATTITALLDSALDDSALLFEEAILDKLAAALDSGIELTELILEAVSDELASDELSILEIELLCVVSVAAARLLRALEIISLLPAEPPPQAVKVSNIAVEIVLLTKYFASCMGISNSRLGSWSLNTGSLLL